jgi:hypothetical protein
MARGHTILRPVRPLDLPARCTNGYNGDYECGYDTIRYDYGVLVELSWQNTSLGVLFGV